MSVGDVVEFSSEMEEKCGVSASAPVAVAAASAETAAAAATGADALTPNFSSISEINSTRHITDIFEIASKISSFDVMVLLAIIFSSNQPQKDGQFI
jgi:hypothetical protein